MLNILLSKPNFFSIIFLVILLLVNIYFLPDFESSYIFQVSSVVIVVLSFYINIEGLKKNILLNYTHLNLLILFLFYLMSTPYIISLEISSALLFISVIQLLYNIFQEDNFLYYYRIEAIFLLVANIIFPLTLAFTIFFILYIFLSGTRRISFFKFIVTYGICILLIIQILYLTDNFGMIKDYLQQFFLPSEFSVNYSIYYLIPLLLITIVAILDRVFNMPAHSFKKRNLWNYAFLLFILLILFSALCSDKFFSIFIFFYFPIGIFIGRFITYIKNSWIQGIVIILFVFSCLIFKWHEYVLN